jgi:flagellar protein FlgJ
MATDISSAQALAIDGHALDRLKAAAKSTPDKALKAAATQFEAVFMNMLLKSMRESLPQDGPFQSEQTKLYTGMLDQQLAQQIATRGTGLADLMVKQLSHHSSPHGVPSAADPATPNKAVEIHAAIQQALTGSATQGSERSAPKPEQTKPQSHSAQTESNF